MGAAGRRGIPCRLLAHGAGVSVRIIQRIWDLQNPCKKKADDPHGKTGAEFEESVPKRGGRMANEYTDAQCRCSLGNSLQPRD